MHKTLATLIDLLETWDPSVIGVIPWGSPVPAFGDPRRARIATLGLNPSNREFVDSLGNELDGRTRRLHTLNSLGLASWAEADARHIHEIIAYCHEYFQRNPYDRWFRTLDRIMAGVGASYYKSKNTACHLDLIPYATASKWINLTSEQRTRLLTVGATALARLLATTSIRVLILNGRAVVSQFSTHSQVRLTCTPMPDWSLPRRSGNPVRGFAFQGTLTTLCGHCLDRSITVLGYNHNLQSSYGVTSAVRRAIGAWVTDSLSAEGVP